MGTNYYIEFNVCPACGKPEETYHIGKSSWGWCFSLHVDPSRDINTLEDVQGLWEGQVIRDEYRRTIDPKEMLATITERKEPGPNGLLRHEKNGRCIGHGEGTWDYVTGEFC